jgi:hypothetical protein
MDRLINIYNFFSLCGEGLRFCTKNSTDTWMRNLIITYPENIYTSELTFAHPEAEEMNGKQNRRDLFTRYMSVTFILIFTLNVC